MISHPAPITRARASWMALALLLWGDCTKAPRDTRSDRAGNGGSALDSAALRDLEMANRPERSLPELHDVPVQRPPSSPRGARPAPSERSPTVPAAAALARDTATPSPAPAPAVNTSAVAAAHDTAGTVPGVAAGHVSAGTVIVLSPHVSVCTRFNAVGDLFVSTLTSPIVGAGGVTIPAGVIVSVQITAVARSPGGGAVLDFAVRSFGRLQDGSVPELTPELGDITAPVGRLAGHAMTEATLLGTCVPRDGELRLTLTQPVRILRRG
jgi:hypothetical protein